MGKDSFDPIVETPAADGVNDHGMIPGETSLNPAEGDRTAPVDAHGSCTAAGQINYLTDGLMDLRARLSKLEAAVLNIENSGANNSNKDAAKNTMQQIQNVARQIEAVTEGLRTTPDYNLGKIFNCASCSSNGTIAIKVKCTSCGKENWWGYWPPKNKLEK